MKILGVYREAVYSPGKVADDAAILDAALSELSGRGFEVKSVHAEDVIGTLPRADLVLSMAQSEAMLRSEERWQKKGIEILNSPKSVRNCYRKPLVALLTASGVPMPGSRIVTLPEAEKQIASRDGDLQCWLKRGDVHAMEQGDVVKVTCREEMVRGLDHFQTRGIDQLLIQDHVEGPTVKFYGVGEGDYFKAFLSATGEEFTPPTEELMRMAIRCAGILGLEIYGGDAILADGGRPTLVDLNDWPSYSLCRPSAAKGIAGYVQRRRGSVAHSQHNVI